MAISINRLSGGNTPADGSDPRTFPAIWNATADTLEDGIISTSLTSPSTGQLLQFDGTNWVNVGQAEAGAIPVFADSTARSSAIPSPTEGMVTYLEDADELEVYTTAWGAVSTPGILQVASTTKTDTFNTTSSSYIDITGLSVTITPTASSSKIMVFLNLQGMGDSGNALGFVRLVRDSTSIGIGAAAGSRTRASFALYDDNASTTNSGAMQVLDEPSTTSPVTYKVQGFTPGSSVFYVNQSKTDSDLSDFGRFASTITVMEVAG